MPTNHKSLAEGVRARVGEAPGAADPALRRQVFTAGTGTTVAPEPYAGLALRIAERSYRVTDADVKAVRSIAGSDKATFEVVVSAAVGAGLFRWDEAMRVLTEAFDEIA